MKLQILCHSDLINTTVADEKKEITNPKAEKIIEERLRSLSGCPNGSLLYICFNTDRPIKAISAGMVVLGCIKKKFPQYAPSAVLINTLPSQKLTIEIEFGSFMDIGKAFAG